MSSRFSLEAILTMTDRITGPMKKAAGSVNTFSNSMQRSFEKTNAASYGFGASVKKMGGYLLAGFGAASVISLANKSIELWKVQEAAIANVEAGIKSTKGAAGLTSQALQDMASKLQGNSIFGDESILQNATAQLLTFTGITKSNFERVQSVVADVTSKLKGVNATGEDLRGVSIMMGKAMENPIRGLTAMRRIGISFSDQEEAVVKQMMAHNDVIGAQNYMLKGIERQYGGTAKAMAMTAAGQGIQRTNRIGDALEQIGKKLLPMKVTMVAFIDAILPAVVELVGTLGDIFTAITPAIQAFKASFGLIKPLIKPIVYGFLAWRAAILAVAIAQGIASGLGWIQYLWMMRAAIMQAVTMTNAWSIAQTVLNAIMSANPIALAVIGIALLIGYVIIAIKYWGQFGQAMMILLGPIGFFLSALVSIYNHWGKIKQAFATGGILAGLKAIGIAIIDGLLAPVQQLFDLLAKIPGVGKHITFGNDIKSMRESLNGDSKPKKGTYNSPNTASSETTVNNRSWIDVMFNNTPKGTEVKQSGRTAPGTTLALGVN